MTEESIDFYGFRSFRTGFCRCGCWMLTTFYQGKFRKFIHAHSTKDKRFGGGDKHPLWKGGIDVDQRGYTHVQKPDHPFCNCQGYVMKHRLTYENYLSILFDEDVFIPNEYIVHHIIPVSKGGTNNIGNLMFFKNHSEHQSHEMIGNKRGRQVDTTNRFCLLCNNKTYVTKNGYEHWRKYENGFICSICYKRECRRRKREGIT